MNINNTNWVTIKDAAKWLGVTEQTIRNWIAQGVFPAYQINPRGRILIKAEEVKDTIEAGKLKPKRYGL
ncbi:helix-turn-helix domain-containing protein [Chloroflexota bacterium]